MVRLINWLTGNDMYVAEDRVDEYLDAGHKMPISKIEPVKEKPAITEKPKSRKKTTKK